MTPDRTSHDRAVSFLRVTSVGSGCPWRGFIPDHTGRPPNTSAHSSFGMRVVEELVARGTEIIVGHAGGLQREIVVGAIDLDGGVV